MRKVMRKTLQALEVLEVCLGILLQVPMAIRWYINLRKKNDPDAKKMILFGLVTILGMTLFVQGFLTHSVFQAVPYYIPGVLLYLFGGRSIVNLATAKLYPKKKRPNYQLSLELENGTK